MTRELDAEHLSERAQQLLKLLVRRYITDGQPIGSRTLSKEVQLSLSPATIRNVMADLEDLGFLASPHPSAGRVPTQAGYRFFVDSLLTVKPLRNRVVAQLRAELESDVADSRALAEAASVALSEVTQLAGLVTVPRSKQITLSKIEFLPLSDHRALAILVINDLEVQNRIIYLDRNYEASELRDAARFLNEQFAGKEIGSVREELIRRLDETQQQMNDLMVAVVRMAQQIFEGDEEGGFVLAGETNLMDFAELSDVDKLRRLFEAFNEQRDILHLLDRCLAAEGVQIFIGQESGFEILDECSIVTAPYTVDDETVGVLGVIGPTRMAYERVIPIVDLTARLLGAALKSR